MLPLLIIASAGLSTMLIHQWLKRAHRDQSLMAYTAPFVALGWLLLSLNAAPAASLSATPPVNAHTLLQGLFSGLGQVMLLPSPIAGLLIVLGLWLSHWRAALWPLAGSLAGLGFSLLEHETLAALSGLGGYNAALAALALSQGTRQPWRPLAGIALALLLTPGFAALGLPALTAPFILSCWLVHASIRIIKPAGAQSGLRIER